MKRNLPILLVLAILLPSACKAQTPDSVMKDIQKMATVSGKAFELYGLYPGMTRSEAIEIAQKKGDKVQVFIEESSHKSSLLYETENPTATIAIDFYHPKGASAENVPNEIIRARKIKIVQSPQVPFAQFKAQEFYDFIVKKFGKPVWETSTSKMIHAHYAIGKLGVKALSDQCKAIASPEDYKEASQISRAIKTPANYEHIKLILNACPSLIDEYKKIKASELGPKLWFLVSDGDQHVNLWMGYLVNEYFATDYNAGPNYKRIVK